MIIIDKKFNVNIDEFIVNEDAKLSDAMIAFNNNGKAIAFVCCNLKLLATITDGDVRRHVLDGGDASSLVKDVAQYNPITLHCNSTEDPHFLIRKHFVSALPVVDDGGKIVSIIFRDGDIVSFAGNLSIPVVVMAGGKGTRLHPYTHILPKPLLPIGEKPVIEHILEQFHAFGCSDFRIVVNYKRDLIKAFFAESEDRPYRVSFVDEDNYLGTGGGLFMLSGKIDTTFVLTNCDTLIKADFADMYMQHIKNSNLLTMVCAKKKITLPYGIVDVTSEGIAKKLEEKPCFEYIVNTGVYVIQPEFLSIVPENTEIHITELIQKCMDRGEKIGTYSVHENSWTDMGSLTYTMQK